MMSAETKKIEYFTFTANKTDEGLSLEAENQSNGDLYSKVINKELVKTPSSGSFFDFETICHVLQNYKKGEKELLSLTEDGKLTYECQVMLGSFSKTSGFTIDLDKKEIDPQMKLQKSLQNLSVKVSKIEEAISSQGKNGLEEMMKTNEERFNVFEKTLLDKLEMLETSLNKALEKVQDLEQSEKGVTRLDLHFNPSGVYASKYILSENNKAAIANEASNYVLFAKTPLPANKTSEFTFLILKSDFIMVGIAPENTLDNRKAYEDKCTVGYSNEGYLYRLAGNNGGGLKTYKEGDKVSFKVDFKTGKINVCLNEKSVCEHVIDEENRNKAYYPFIFTNSQEGCGAKFV